ncbi:MAG: hypothetical protein IPG23_19105 [Burkholderiales bacterium]|jgi:hypothetical protein|nr:hypothetical protein [Burkholderiales bacterium]
MNQRRRKRTVTGFFHHLFYNSKFIWKSAEDQAWDNMAPVGREFGSPDYERLEAQDWADFKSNLSSLVEA